MRFFVAAIVIILFLSSIQLDAEKPKYEMIQKSFIEQNFTYAEKLIEEEKQSNLGDPKLEFYEVELWLKKANELYEKKQFKDALIYYYKLGAIYPNHPTVRERIDIWKDKEPYNELNTRIKVNKKLETSSAIIQSKDGEYVADLQRDYLLLSEKMEKVSSDLGQLNSSLRLLIGVVIGLVLSNIVFFLLMIVAGLKR